MKIVLLVFFAIQYFQDDSVNLTVQINKESFEKDLIKDLVKLSNKSQKRGYYKVKVDTDFVSIGLKFEAKHKKTNFILDWSAFCLTYNNPENFNPNITNFDSILYKLSNSQVVIQNIYDEFRFFHEGKIKENYLYNEYLLKMCWTEDEIFDISNPIIKKSNSFLRENLRIRDEDRKIKIHYFFIPNEEQIMKGFVKFRISSDWFDI